MFEQEKCKLGMQLQRIDGITIEQAIDTQRDFALTRGGGEPVTVDKLIDLFVKNIDPASFEHIVAYGEDVGAGLYSFGNFARDPQTGLYLCYREYMKPFLGHGKQLYIGAYPIPPDYDEIAIHGVKDGIQLHDDFKCYAASNSPASEAIKILYEELMQKDLVVRN